MKKLLLLILVLFLCISVIGCKPRQSKRIKPPAYDTQSIANGAIKKYDLNGDGQISGDELDKAPCIKNAFPDMPSVTATEIANKVRMWKESRLGLHFARIQISQGDNYLENADLTVSSEDFMGAEKISFTAKTDERGRVILNAPNSYELPGIPCGFYKIDVQYNGQTYNLGLEVRPDSHDTIKLQIPEK